MRGTRTPIAHPLLELVHEVGILEVLGHIVVEAGDDLVDCLLPRLLRILVLLQGAEKFAKRSLAHNAKVFRNLFSGGGGGVERERERDC